MLAIAMVLALQAASPPPDPPPLPFSPEALTLARELAEAGTLATLMPMLIDKDLAELAAERPELTAPQRERLLATGRAIATRRRDTMMQAMAVSYAKRLSVADLRTLVAASRTPAAKAKRAADVPATMMAMTMIGPVDLKRETAAQFCTDTRLFCDR